jgi:selenocysteine-specific elongation factor
VRVVATAGHVDHGKSSLVLALTGTDPDRFPEEKARGLTIDLGFAFCTLPSGQVVGFVDVPGHVRFVKNMLAGVGAVDVALLVIAANEGWMPQTEEHVQILDLLDIRHGMIALTKAALVDDDTLELARLEADERLEATARSSWPVVVVDSPTGRGVAEVAATLDDVLRGAPPPVDVRRPRLWIDRVFAAKGAGTIVTGTLTGGALARDDDVVVEPGGRRARVRSIESHHAKLERVEPGARVALNLAGVDHHELRRGDAVVLPDQWAVVDTIDVALRTLPGHAFPKRGPVDAHVGSGEQRARFRLLDAEHARVSFPDALPLAPGDRVVLRSSGQQATVGGGEVLDVAVARRTADALARASMPLAQRVLAARPWCTPAEFARLAGRPPDDDAAVAVGAWLVAPAELERVRARAAELHTEGYPPVTTVAAACGIEVAQLRAALGDETGESPLDDPHARELIDAIDAQPFAPVEPDNPALVRALVRAGALVDLDGVIFTARAVDDARTLIAAAVVERGELTVADARDLLGTTRKFILPILNRTDREGVTKRRGDVRVPGPRATAAGVDRGT